MNFKCKDGKKNVIIAYNDNYSFSFSIADFFECYDDMQENHFKYTGNIGFNTIYTLNGTIVDDNKLYIELTDNRSMTKEMFDVESVINDESFFKSYNKIINRNIFEKTENLEEIDMIPNYKSWFDKETGLINVEYKNKTAKMDVTTFLRIIDKCSDTNHSIKYEGYVIKAGSHDKVFVLYNIDGDKEQNIIFNIDNYIPKVFDPFTYKNNNIKISEKIIDEILKEKQLSNELSSKKIETKSQAINVNKKINNISYSWDEINKKIIISNGEKKIKFDIKTFFELYRDGYKEKNNGQSPYDWASKIKNEEATTVVSTNNNKVNILATLKEDGGNLNFDVNFTIATFCPHLFDKDLSNDKRFDIINLMLDNKPEQKEIIPAEINKRVYSSASNKNARYEMPDRGLFIDYIAKNGGCKISVRDFVKFATSLMLPDEFHAYIRTNIFSGGKETPCLEIYDLDGNKQTTIDLDGCVSEYLQKAAEGKKILAEAMMRGAKKGLEESVNPEKIIQALSKEKNKQLNDDYINSLKSSAKVINDMACKESERDLENISDEEKFTDFSACKEKCATIKNDNLKDELVDALGGKYERKINNTLKTAKRMIKTENEKMADEKNINNEYKSFVDYFENLNRYEEKEKQLQAKITQLEERILDEAFKSAGKDKTIALLRSENKKQLEEFKATSALLTKLNADVSEGFINSTIENQKIIKQYNILNKIKNTIADQNEDLRAKSLPNMIKNDASQALYRVGATQMMKGLRAAIIALLQKAGKDNNTIKVISDLLDSEIGIAILSCICGYSVEQLVDDNEMAKKFAKELRVHGMATAGNAAFETLYELITTSIVPILSSVGQEKTENIVEEEQKPLLQVG